MGVWVRMGRACGGGVFSSPNPYGGNKGSDEMKLRKESW